jgi:tetratricopeptide (TPR) repeat protein
MRKISFRSGLLILLFLMTSVLAVNAETPLEFYRHGRILQLSGNYYQAIEAYKSALDVNPYYFEPLLGLSECYYQLEEFEESIILIDEAVKFGKRRPEVYILKGKILISLGKIEDAIAQFEEALKIEPNNIDARLGYAELEIARGKPNLAAEKFLETLKVAPYNRAALLSLAIIFDSFDNHQRAKEYLRTALKYHGEDAQVQLITAYHYLDNDNMELAGHHATLAVQIEPSYIEALLLQGNLLLDQGEYLKAISAAEQILVINRDHNLAWYLKGTAHERLGETDKAILSLRMSIRSAPADEISRIALEIAAREHLDIEDPLREEIAEFHFSKGSGYEDRNFFSKARYEYRRGLQIAPFSEKGRLKYAEILNKIGFHAKYVAELGVIIDLGLADTKTRDLHEIHSSLETDSIPNRWNINQFEIEKNRLVFSLFYENNINNVIHYGIEGYTASVLHDLMTATERIDFREPPAGVGGFSEAFRGARESGSDYFILLSVVETAREFSIEGKVYLSRSGNPVQTLRTFNTGDDRVALSLLKIYQDTVDIVPLRGELILREFEKGLIDLGIEDGIEPENELVIVRKGNLVLKRDSTEFLYDPVDVLGTFTVTEVDDLVSEGIIEHSGFYDVVTSGDEVVFAIEAQEENVETGFYTSDLYRKIIRIH